MFVIINEILTVYAANCGPLPSASGYVLPYTSTLEGSSVMFRCQNDLQSEVTAVCTRAGKWEPSPTDICDGSCKLIQLFITTSIIFIGLHMKFNSES